ncbi:hypothetical protein [Stratiformator vulcanicus]|uniref:Uncharacterized protein n=1 Tax=Stratiformator vulcanicus TaxID=2527980 RepID=A0A517QX01_9PLAN|nr:hypothetical protein [Stratiformator vulcanicus]QDT36192.1 hypothetical protein Pan189_05470 [Stratiformator vulcanicus]
MALFTRQTWPQHRPWIIALVIGVVVCLGLFCYSVFASQGWPSGSSGICLSLGIAAAALMVFEALLGVRKKWLRVWRIGSARMWLAAHIWLGILILPLTLCHAGFSWGGWLNQTLMWLFLVVWFSGIIGALLQTILPTLMFEQVQSETVYSQIDRMTALIRADALRVFHQLNSKFKFDPTFHDQLSEERAQLEQKRQNYRVSGVVRSAGLATGRVAVIDLPGMSAGETKEIEQFGKDYVDSFLRPEIDDAHPLADAKKSQALFRTLKSHVEPEMLKPVDMLEALCGRRRDLIRQKKIHFWLHVWLLLHLPISVVVMVLLAVHIVVSILYW